MVEYSIPFDKASFKIVIKAAGENLEWETYIKGKHLVSRNYMFTMVSISTVFDLNLWLALILGSLLACAICGVIFMYQAEDTDSWLRSFNLVCNSYYPSIGHLI